MLKFFWPEGLQLSIAVTLFAAAPWISPKLNAQERAYTVEDALNVGSGLGQLVKTDVVDKDGKPTSVYFQFSAEVRIAMAVNIDVSRRAQAAFERALNDLRLQLSAGSGTVPDEKKVAFAAEVSKLAAAPAARVDFVRIAMKDLCLSARPPECPVANAIPAPVLSLILPIVDR